MSKSAPNVSRILVVDDNAQNVQLLVDKLMPLGYQVRTANGGREALACVEREPPDLILLDVVMPEMDGYAVCRAIKAEPATEVIPIIMVTALDPKEERIRGLEAGADEFLGKPFSNTELLARVRSLLRIKTLFDEVAAKSAALADLASSLEERVRTQVGEIERLKELRRFLSPPVADALATQGNQSYLKSHRREIAVLFCDLRNFTGFSEVVEPEDAIAVLQEYHEALGDLVDKYEGTIDHRAGDGMMVFFNDPLPCDDPAERAVRCAMEMRGRLRELRRDWARFGEIAGFGVGISYGYATIGLIGHERRLDYAASGRPVNLASRLCDVAKDGQILVTERLLYECRGAFEAEPIGEVEIRGMPRSTPLYNIVKDRPDAA